MDNEDAAVAVAGKGANPGDLTWCLRGRCAIGQEAQGTERVGEVNGSR